MRLGMNMGCAVNRQRLKVGLCGQLYAAVSAFSAMMLEGAFNFSSPGSFLILEATLIYSLDSGNFDHELGARHEDLMLLPGMNAHRKSEE